MSTMSLQADEAGIAKNSILNTLLHIILAPGLIRASFDKMEKIFQRCLRRNHPLGNDMNFSMIDENTTLRIRWLLRPVVQTIGCLDQQKFSIIVGNLDDQIFLGQWQLKQKVDNEPLVFDVVLKMRSPIQVVIC